MRLRRMILRAGPATPEHAPTSFMSPSERSAVVARHLLEGAFEEEALAAALERAAGRPRASLPRMARQLVEKFGRGRRLRWREVADFLRSRPDFWRVFLGRFQLPELPRAEPVMRPAAGPPEAWKVPAIPTIGALAEWLGLTLADLNSLSARWRDQGERRRTQHYHYRWIARRGRLPRLIEAPKPRLKAVQRRILSGILDLIPAHAAAHGFRAGRNIVSFAAPHAGRRCVLRMDVHDFFPSLRRARVLRVFLNAGYPEPVAALLADLCTTVTPAAIRQAVPGFGPTETWPLQQKLQSRHLPQGAPTSPALANLCAFALDARLAGLARRFEASYTRYADDLLFSGAGDFGRSVRRCEVHVGAILIESGLAAAHRKTRVMPQSVSQRAAGLVLNERPGLPRHERDRLKAILTNCVRHGPASQNREGHPTFQAHLRGRVAHALATHPASGAKLLAIFEQIVW